MHRLSAVIITRNEEASIGRCLASLQGLADEIVVVDSFSADRTPAICVSSPCRFFQKEFEGYGRQKQYAVDLASNDWVLSIDADEEVSPELKEEILCFLRRERTSLNGLYIRRDLVYLGRRMRFGGVSGERILRLFNKRHGRFDDAPVHEKIGVEGPVTTLSGRLLHYSYRNLGHHLSKINEYTGKAAEDYIRKGKRFSRLWVPVKFKIRFFTTYFVKGGIFDGYPGFIWALMGAWYAALKISKTIELAGKSEKK